MSDFKSKLPDLKELGAMTVKFCKDVKKSVDEIIADYKEKHPQAKAEAPKKETAVKKAKESAETKETKETKAKDEPK